MALALTLEKLDGLEDSVKGLYVERDGKFMLDVDGLEDTAGLKSALEAERKARREFEKKYGALKDVDPEEYTRLKREAEEREAKKLEEKGEFEKIRAKWQQERDTEKADFDRRLQEKDALLKKYVLDNQVRNCALRSGVIPEDIDDVMVITGRYFKLAEDGSIQVLDDSGEITPKTIDDFFARDFKAKRPKFYSTSGASGSGASGAAGTGSGGAKTPMQQLQEQHAAASKAGNHALAIALKRKMHELQASAGQ